MTKLFGFFNELVALPDFRIETWRTLRRQMSLASYQPFTEFLAIVIEPLMLLFVLSWGLGYWLKEIDGHPYSHFAVPAVAVLACVFIPFWEVAFGVFSRLRQNHGYWVALQGPIQASDLGYGEILWATLKGTLSVMVVLIFGWSMGWVQSNLVLISPVVVFPGALLSSSFGLWCAVRMQSPSQLILVQGLFLGPLTLWSDTLFPFSQMSAFADWITFLSPPGHLVHMLRMLTSAEISADFFLSLALLWAVGCIATNYAVRCFRQKLIPSR